MKSAVKFLQEVKVEIGKVVWPKKSEVVKLTLIVISISGIIAIYVGILDVFFTKLLELILS